MDKRGEVGVGVDERGEVGVGVDERGEVGVGVKERGRRLNSSFCPRRWPPTALIA